MSFNRENITWQSQDGSWNIGFYDYYKTNNSDYDEDYDPEWDVEYTDNFHWVSTGHVSKQSANNAWKGSNPGGGEIVEYNTNNQDYIRTLDDKAAQTFQAVKNPKVFSSQYNNTPHATGPEKKRDITLIAGDYYTNKIKAISYKIGGYLNLPDERLSYWKKELDKFSSSINEKTSPDDIKTINGEMQKYKNFLNEKVNETNNSLNNRFASNNAAERARKKETLKILSGEIDSLTPISENIVTIDKKTSPRGGGPNSRSLSSSSGSTKSYGKYHINPKTGRPNKCTATKKSCPFGDSSSHYDTKEEAGKAYEKNMASKKFTKHKK